LNKQNFLDLFKSYERALGRILTVLSGLAKDTMDLRGNNSYIGKREIVDFAPFTNWPTFIRDILKSYPVSSAFINKTNALYVTFNTKHGEVIIAEHLL
jgi:hypothetical protein